MKLHLTLQHGSRTSEHQLEAPRSPGGEGGTTRFVLNNRDVEVDWAEVAPGIYSLVVDGRSYEAHVTTHPGRATANHQQRIVTVGRRHYEVMIHDPRRRPGARAVSAAQGPQEVLAPMPGKIVKVLVDKDQEVSPGTGLLVIEAMKMQNELRAPRAGRVEEIYVEAGKGVETGARLVRLV
jgi:biotin carboxyl carrier protein